MHCKRKRARWRMIASRDDTPVWPRGATLNATLPPPPRNSTTTHTRTQPPSPQCTAATGVYRIFVCSNRPTNNTHIFKSQFTRILEFGQTRPRPAFRRLGLVHILQLRFFRGRSARVNFGSPLQTVAATHDPKMSCHQRRTLNDLSSNNVMLPTNT